MSQFNVLILMSPVYQVTSEQIQYLMQGVQIMNAIQEINIIIVTQLFNEKIESLGLKQIVMVDLTSEQLIELLQNHQIHLFLTSEISHLTTCANPNYLIALIHKKETMYPLKLAIETVAFNQLQSTKLLEAIACLQNHPNYLIEISLIKSYGSSIHSKALAQFTYAQGVIKSELFLVQATVAEVIHFEKPTLYLSGTVVKEEQWFCCESVGKLYI